MVTDFPGKAKLPPSVRPRAEVGSLSEAELLAVLFRQGCSRKAAIELSGRLLARFGGLRALLVATRRELAAEEGVGQARLAVLRVIPELARRYYEQALPAGLPIRSPADTEAFLMARLRDLPHELFCCIYLDNRHRIISFEELFRGTIDGTSVYPREVVKQALSVNAAGTARRLTSAIRSASRPSTEYSFASSSDN